MSQFKVATATLYKRMRSSHLLGLFLVLVIIIIIIVVIFLRILLFVVRLLRIILFFLLGVFDLTQCFPFRRKIVSLSFVISNDNVIKIVPPFTCHKSKPMKPKSSYL